MSVRQARLVNLAMRVSNLMTRRGFADKIADMKMKLAFLSAVAAAVFAASAETVVIEAEWFETREGWVSDIDYDLTKYIQRNYAEATKGLLE